MSEGPVITNRLRERLARGEIVVSLAVRLVRGVEIAQIAAAAGFDTLYVDLEHSAIGIESAGQICMAALAVGVTPLVRVPALTPEFIGRALDGGALGVIVPHVHSAAEARAVVRLARFPPLGSRSAGGNLPQFGFRQVPASVGQPALDAATMVVPMIESREALERIEEIVAVEGIDMVLVGSNDLTAELGIPGRFDHPLLHEAYERIIAAARRHGRHVGIGGLAGRPDLVARVLRMGARYVSAGADVALLAAACAEQVRALRGMAP